MNRDHSRLLLCTLTAAVVVTATDASAFPNPFKRKPLDTPLAPAQLQAAEGEAGNLLKQAQDLDAAGKTGAAASSYKRIVDRYPLTSFAPVAQFRLASAYERDGKFSKAFDTYQELVETYRQSAQFGEAIDRQMAIAMQSRSEKLGSFLGIAKKLDPVDQLDMFQKVIASAPRGRRAAEAQFEVAKIHEEQNDQDAAIAAYRKVVEDYPSSPLAADAQSKVGKTYLDKVGDGSRDAANIAKARAAAEEAGGLFPDQAVPDLQNTRTQVDDLAADTAWKTAKFYEKSGNRKAAVLYYSDVMRSPGNAHFDDARARIAALTSADPKLLDSLPKLAISPKDLAVQAAVDLKNKANYFGPPGPASKVAVQKPKMRTGNDQIPAIQLDEPDLPTGADGMLKPDNALLDPSQPPSIPAPSTPADGSDLKPGDAVPAPEAPASEPPSLAPPAEPALPPPSEPEPELPAPVEPAAPKPAN
ncbi:MAG: tetratricopeptide repeat protein [Verrucomicrobiota bacterium]